MNNDPITFPTTANAQALRAAILIALADEDFMGTKKKIDNAVEALTPKDTLTAILKRLQGNANRDFLEKMDQNAVGYTAANRSEKIQEYVHARFATHMVNPKTAEKATKLFKTAYPDPVSEGETQH